MGNVLIQIALEVNRMWKRKLKSLCSWAFLYKIYHIKIKRNGIYGLRKYKKQLKEDSEIAKELQDGNKTNQRADSDN